MTSPHATLNLPQSLGDGLMLRLATTADIETLAEFNTKIHLEEGEPPDFLANWTRVLMSGQHPKTSAADFVVIEDTDANHKIVSAACLIPQMWVYDKIPFAVGQPELVGTDPAYRRRGLTRTIFRKIHALSAAYGHLVQGITGIPWFYRQFGYEYALDLGGGRKLHLDDIPALNGDESEPYQIRRATEADIPTLRRLYRRYTNDKLVSSLPDEAYWRYDLSTRNFLVHHYCLLNNQGRLVGAYAAAAEARQSIIHLWAIVVDDAVSLRAVLPSVMRALKKHSQNSLSAAARASQKLTTIRFSLGGEHPAYEAFDAQLGPLQPPYGWYIRVPDLPGFIRHIAPVLEKRLAASVMSEFTGELKLTFYRGGLRLAFEQGKLTTAKDWREPAAPKKWDGAGFPPLVFLQLLFGYRSLDELRHAFPDCWADEEPALLLKALFPRQASWVIPLE